MALPGVDCLLCLVGEVVVLWEHLEVDAVCSEEGFKGLGVLIVNGEGRGLDAPAEQVLDQPRLRSHQLWGCVFLRIRSGWSFCLSYTTP